MNTKSFGLTATFLIGLGLIWLFLSSLEFPWWAVAMIVILIVSWVLIEKYR
jgi:hypothetical protein